MVTDRHDDRKRPKIEAKDDPLLIYFRLCKTGYAKSIQEAEQLTARQVLQALNYEQFCDDYEAESWELNK